MSREGAQMFVGGLVVWFDRGKPVASPETLSLYISELERYDDEVLNAAMGRIVRRCTWLPAMAEILECVDEAREELAEHARTSRRALPEPRRDPDTTRRGLELVRKTLVRMGVMPPPRISREPLTEAERRHEIHERLGPLIPASCRFCADLEARV